MISDTRWRTLYIEFIQLIFFCVQVEMEEESHQKLRIKLNINCGSEKFDNAVTALDKFVMVHRFW